MTNEVAEVTEAAKNVFVENMAQGQTFLTSIKDWIGENGVDFLFNFLFAILIWMVGKVVINIAVGIMRKGLNKHKKVNELLEVFVCSAAKNVGCVLLGMIVLKRIGVDIAPLIAGLGVTGFILGFAFQESLANLAAGMMIAINSPFKVGDYVQVGGIEGVVKELNMMATTLATVDNKKVIMPNKVVWGAAITNFSAHDTRRIDIPVGIAYGADINKALKVMAEVHARHPELIQDPPPAQVVAGLGDSSVNLVLRQWVKSEQYWDQLSGLTQELKEAFDANGIEIPFPQMDVHVINK